MGRYSAPFQFLNNGFWYAQSRGDTLARMNIQSIESSYRAGESHRLAYTQWGAPDNPELLFCAHGLSRNGRDFDYLAAAMAERYHVVCPDYPGRGLSEKLSRPEDYDNGNYLIDSLNLLRTLGSKTVDWVGTSMGGIIGMLLASQEHSPIRRLVLNDVGSFVPRSALLEIAAYLGYEPRFATREEACQYFRKTYIGFGPMSDAQIDHLTEFGIWPLDTGGYQLSCDNAIIQQFIQGKIEDVDLSPWWNAVKVPVLLIRGEQSKLFSAETMADMAENREAVATVEFPDCGHAPSLMHPEHIRVIKEWLATP